MNDSHRFGWLTVILRTVGALAYYIKLAAGALILTGAVALIAVVFLGVRIFDRFRPG